MYFIEFLRIIIDADGINALRGKAKELPLIGGINIVR